MLVLTKVEIQLKPRLTFRHLMQVRCTKISVTCHIEKYELPVLVFESGNHNYSERILLVYPNSCKQVYI